MRPILELGPSPIRKYRYWFREGGGSTTISIEPQFLDVLRAMAAEREITLPELIRRERFNYGGKNFSSHMRLVALAHAKEKAN